MKIVNCTPHPLVVIKNNGETINFPKGEIIPRLTQSTDKVDEIQGINITCTLFGETVDMPEPIEGVKFIVSRMILSAHPERSDLLVPNELVRDEEGQIIGCKSLACN